MSPESAPTICFNDVRVQFDSHIVHDGLTFSLNAKEVTTLLGPSGAGKTLILKLIIGLIFASRGTVTVMGKDVNSLRETELRELRVHIGMLFQGAALFDSLSIFENIAYGLRERGEKDEEKLRHIVDERLGMVGLPGIEKKLPSQLSGGQKKRVGLARALATSPRIMLYDEPTTGLDPTSTRMIDELIVKFKEEQGITSLVVTHDIQSAARISDRWMLLNGGKIVADGAVADVAKNNQLVSSFINGVWEGEV
jgi:phospholipid/cholesterol/gamma-HCH transport system ATP-binding protein